MIRVSCIVLSLLFICASVSSQITLSIEDKKVYLNGQELTEEPDKLILDQLVKEKSKRYYITSSYNPETKEINRIHRRGYNYRDNGFYLYYYAKEKGIYSILVSMRASQHKPSKNSLQVFKNIFQDGNIILDSSSTLEKTVALIGKEKLISSPANETANNISPYLLYAKNDFLIEIFFDKKTQLIQQIYIRR